MNKKLITISSIVLLFLISSCSSVSITQMRYKKGLNIGIAKADENSKENLQSNYNNYKSKRSSKLSGRNMQLEHEYLTEKVQPVLTFQTKKTDRTKVKDEAPAKVAKKTVVEMHNYSSNIKVKKSKRFKTLFNISKDFKKNNIVDQKNAGDSQLIAGLLAFCFGALGIHRFYLGYTWQGIVQLLTFGGLGVWALIDLIRIIIGDLEPKDGSYS
jgi:hypothetical protein